MEALADILLYVCSAYLIWYFIRKRKARKLAKQAQEHPIGTRHKEREKELKKQRKLLGLTESSTSISQDKIIKKVESENGYDLIFIPPFPVNADPRISTITSGEYPEYILHLYLPNFGTCNIHLGVGAMDSRPVSTVRYGAKVIHFTPGEDAYLQKKEQEERDRQRRQKDAEEREKREIERKIKERQRKRDLEKLVRQELIDNGELFGEQTKRPPIPREVVDAVYKRDGGRCVYCGSTENLQLDHIIPFSKGGSTTVENLQLLCQKCNLEKSNHIG